MTDLVYKMVEMALPYLKPPVLECGSYIVEGQEQWNLRQLFPGADYTGLDFRKGPGVDVVSDIHTFKHEKKYNTILCLNTLEHVNEPIKAIENMRRYLSPEGVLMITIPFNFHIHDYPQDYWRMTPQCLAKLLRFPGDYCFVYGCGEKNNPHTVVGIYSQALLWAKMREFELAFERRFDRYREPRTLKKKITDALVPPAVWKAYMKVKHHK